MRQLFIKMRKNENCCSVRHNCWLVCNIILSVVIIFYFRRIEFVVSRIRPLYIITLQNFRRNRSCSYRTGEITIIKIADL